MKLRVTFTATLETDIDPSEYTDLNDALEDCQETLEEQLQAEAVHSAQFLFGNEEIEIVHPETNEVVDQFDVKWKNDDE